MRCYSRRGRDRTPQSHLLFYILNNMLSLPLTHTHLSLSLSSVFLELKWVVDEDFLFQNMYGVHLVVGGLIHQRQKEIQFPYLLSHGQ